MLRLLRFRLRRGFGGQVVRNDIKIDSSTSLGMTAGVLVGMMAVGGLEKFYYSFIRDSGDFRQYSSRAGA